MFYSLSRAATLFWPLFYYDKRGKIKTPARCFLKREKNLFAVQDVGKS